MYLKLVKIRAKRHQVVLRLIYDWGCIYQGEEEGEPCGSPLFTASSTSHTSSQTIVLATSQEFSVCVGWCLLSQVKTLSTFVHSAGSSVGQSWTWSMCSIHLVFPLSGHSGNKIQLHELGACEKQAIALPGLKFQGTPRSLYGCLDE